MISFTEELHSWQENPLAGNESVAGKIEIVPEFPDPEGTNIDICHTENGWQADITIPTEVIPGWKTEYCRFNLSRQFNTYQKLYSWPGVYKGSVITNLGLAFYNPAEMGYFLLPDFSPR